MLLYLIHYQLFELLVTTLHLVQKNPVSEFYHNVSERESDAYIGRHNLDARDSIYYQIGQLEYSLDRTLKITRHRDNVQYRLCVS